MRARYLLLLALTMSFLPSCTTAPTRNDQLGADLTKALAEPFALFYETSMIRSGAIDLLYCSASFHNKQGRWPNNYTELSEFVKQSDGYLVLGEYERVRLNPMPNDGLEVRYVRPGRTIENKFTLGEFGEKK
jgi:hypothetical protein